MFRSRAPALDHCRSDICATLHHLWTRPDKPCRVRRLPTPHTTSRAVPKPHVFRAHRYYPRLASRLYSSALITGISMVSAFLVSLREAPDYTRTFHCHTIAPRYTGKHTHRRIFSAFHRNADHRCKPQWYATKRIHRRPVRISSRRHPRI